MDSAVLATPWGAVPQAEGVVDAIGEKAEDAIADNEKSGDHQRQYSDPTQTINSSATQSLEDKEIEDSEIIHQLARNFTQASVKHPDGNYINPFEGSESPLLNPSSGKFSARAWIKNLVAIQSRDPERYPGRTAGIAYKNLSAHGFGQPTDYQKTFGNYPLEIPSLFKRLIGQQHETKIQILRNFDGLVKSGEMLVVLGRPGSGCSTLLKTISGEIDGFHVSKDSYINYQGSMCFLHLLSFSCFANSDH
jgi:ABC-type multidrug transport system fused ATPase/permease subunit